MSASPPSDLSNITSQEEVLLTRATAHIVAQLSVTADDVTAASARLHGDIVKGSAAQTRRIARHSTSRLGYGVFFTAPVVFVIAIITVIAAVSILNRPAPARVYGTLPGQRAIVRFADGSQAVLAPATSITVTSDRSTHGTDVRIAGQALFTVAHSQTRPFQVYTASIIAHVLGTAFSVRHYREEPETQVSVTDGRLSIHRIGHRTRLSTETIVDRGTRAVFRDMDSSLVLQHIANTDYTAWASGRLIFEHVALREVVADLSRAYAVDIQVPDQALAESPLTWSVPTKTASLSAALRQLCDLIDTHVVQSGHVLTLVRGRGSVTTPSASHPFSTQEVRYGR